MFCSPVPKDGVSVNERPLAGTTSIVRHASVTMPMDSKTFRELNSGLPSTPNLLQVTKFSLPVHKLDMIMPPGWSLRASIRKYRESADRSGITNFFLFDQKNPFGYLFFGNDIKRFDFLFFSSKFAKLENPATGPSAAAMKLEIWHMFNMLVWTYHTLS